MDGPAKKNPDTVPEGSEKAAGNPAEGVAGREEKLIRLYMELTGCGESEARSTYMHVDRAAKTDAGGGG